MSSGGVIRGDRISVRRLGVGVLVGMIGMLVLSGAARGQSGPRHSVAGVTRLQARWHLVATGFDQLLSAPPDVTLIGAPGADGQAVAVIDERTGRLTTLSKPGCFDPVVGAGWLTFNASTGDPPPPGCIGVLYPVAGGAPRSIDPDNGRSDRLALDRVRPQLR